MSQAAPGEAAKLKPGETVFVADPTSEGDKMMALRVQVTVAGVNPTK